MRAEKEHSIADIFLVVRAAFSRYWLIGVGPALVLLALVLLISMRLPSYYTSDALLSVKPQRLTFKLGENAPKDEMKDRLESLIQEVLSRPRKRGIIEKLGLYPEVQDGTPEGKERALKRFNAAISEEFEVSPSGVQSFQTFRVGFTHTDKTIAFQVAERLAKLFLDESVFDRQSEVKNSEEFLDAQLEEARRKLESTEAAVQDFVRQNFNRLPTHLDAAVARLENMQHQLDSTSQLLSSAMTRKGQLQQELSEERRLGAANGETNPSDPFDSLAQLQATLVILESRYSPQHPDVVNTRRRIDALKGQLGSGKHGSPVSSGDSTGARTVKRDMKEVELQIVSYQQETSRLKESIKELQEDIAAMPLKEQELLKIKRDYNNVKENYEKLLGARDDASLQSSLIRSQKAAQFLVLEPAEEPVDPAGPNRLIIVGAGVALAVAILILIPFVLYLINNSFKFKEDLEETLGLPVISVIPPMITPESLGFRSRLRNGSVLASAVSLVSGIAIIFFMI